MRKLLYFISFLIGIVGIFGFLDSTGNGGYYTLPITIAIGGLSAIIVYLSDKHNPKE